jgi:hypothetical protein
MNQYKSRTQLWTSYIQPFLVEDPVINQLYHFWSRAQSWTSFSPWPSYKPVVASLVQDQFQSMAQLTPVVAILVQDQFQSMAQLTPVVAILVQDQFQSWPS